MTWCLRLIFVAIMAGCTLPGAPATIELRGWVTAGPICPVERDPPDPACEDRPVPRAEITVVDADGREVTTIQAGEDGGFAVELPAGRYRLIPQPVDGLMGTAPPLEVLLEEGGEPQLVEIVYDTGIR